MTDQPIQSNDWVSSDPDGYRSFLLLVSMNLETHGVLSEEDAIVDKDGVISIPLQNWVGEWIRGNPTATAKMAKELVKEHLDQLAYDMRPMGTLTYTQTFTVPGGQVTIGGSIACKVSDRVSIKAGYAYLRTQALVGYNEFLRDSQARGATADSHKQSKSTQGYMGNNQGSDPDRNPSSIANGETEKIDFDKVTKATNDAGETVIKLWGGRFAKFGVRLFSDKYANHPGMVTFMDELEFGVHEYHGTFTAWMKEGKAQRVNWFRFNKEK